jgi:hypothetical protein
MRIFSALLLFVISAAPVRADDWLDRVDEALTFSLADDAARVRFSGLLDAEYYHFTRPAPGLLGAKGTSLFNPRLTLFCDTQLGPHVYAFVQARVDRGFDPWDNPLEVRLDEYAIRITPWDDGRLSLQAGRFATVIGNWVERHHSWENPFISAPLIYENVTPIYDAEAAPTAAEFAAGIVDSKYEYNPVIWGPSYATGLSISGRLGTFEYAAEVKNAALASRPETWNALDGGFAHPTVSARVGYKPNAMWNFGISGSDGSYFLPSATADLPKGQSIGDYREQLISQDISFAWHHWQLWAEFFEARFQVPHVGDADTFAYYLEAKYKFSPRLFGALRWNQQMFSDVPNGTGGSAPWAHDIWRIDAAVGFRPTAHTQLKVQYSIENEKHSTRDLGHLIALQFTIRF